MRFRTPSLTHRLLAAFLGLVLAAQAQASVLLQHTPIKNQNEAGFCWSYAATAYLEQLNRRERNGWLDLSEEYLGFYHLADQMAAGLDRIDEGGETFLALDYAAKHGLVPESAFHHKIYRFDVSQAATDALAAYKKEKGIASGQAIPLDEALSLLERTFSTPRIPRATDEFVFHGKRYTPLTFARDRARFRREAHFSLLVADPVAEPELHERQLELVRKALLYGYSVPVGVAMMGSTTETGVWDCEDCDQIADEDTQGGHLILLTDFKTKGGRFGGMTRKELENALKRPTEAWAFKNSWGLGPSVNMTEPGLPGTRALPSWGAFTDRYLRASLRLSKTCEGCEMSFDGYLRNPKIDYLDIRQGELTVPARFVKPAFPGQTSGTPAGLDLSIDWSEVRTLEKKPEASPPEASTLHPELQAIHAVPLERVESGTRVLDQLAGPIQLRVKETAVAGWKLRALSPLAKSVGMTSGYAVGSKQHWLEGSTIHVLREKGHFALVRGVPASEEPGETVTLVRFQAHDSKGRKVGAPLVTELRTVITK